MTGCYEKENEPYIIENFSKCWVAESVLYNGYEDHTAQWSGFTITFEGSKTFTDSKTYITTNAQKEGPWPTSGWVDIVLNDEKANTHKLIRNDGLQIDFSVNGVTLTMNFTIDKTIYTVGDSNTGNGSYTFIMKAL